MQRYHMRWFGQNLPPSGVRIDNRTAHYAGLQIAGPNARALLERVAAEDVGGNALPFLTGREMELGRAPGTIVVRVSYTGELGYELYCPAGYQRGLFDLLRQNGEDLGLRLAGSRAMMSLRLEKSFPGWGLELGSDYTPYEAGLGRFVKLGKDDFIGKAGAQRRAQDGPKERIGTFVVEAGDADAFGGEAVYRNGDLAGYITSGGYGHCVGESLAMGYVKPEYFEPDDAYEIDILGERRPAVLASAARVDADGKRMRG
jgi:dimethylglycine dehydrogenase